MKKLAITLLLLASVAFSTNVSAQKVGHIDFQEILLDMPAYKAAQEQFTAKQTEMETTLQEQNAILQKMVADFKAGEAAMSETSKNFALDDIQAKKQVIENGAANFQKELAELEQKLMGPLLLQIEEAIKIVAKENNFAYVLDVSQGLVIYHAGGEDLGPKVRKHMGIPPKVKTTTPTPE